jgi:multidrug transporter EmrE-like cation transporter
MMENIISLILLAVFLIIGIIGTVAASIDLLFFSETLQIWHMGSIGALLIGVLALIYFVIEFFFDIIDIILDIFI